MADQKYTTVSIPTPLAENIRNRIEGTGFNSISSYVTYILRQVLSSMDEENADTSKMRKEDEKEVKRRLKALGYLD
ncbi:MAG: CopG family transcriptional regulator [Thermoplasmata archaeon]|nr:CopG family transcriptional regulator [Thermoplasmata archaeon]MCK5398034.1 CopG family transcriptional regulator [Thermoplasmata archaeon]